MLLDHQGPDSIRHAIRQNLEELTGVTVVDLHLWQIGPGTYCLAVSLIATDPRPPDHYRQYLPKNSGLAHVTIEVHHATPQGTAGKAGGHDSTGTATSDSPCCGEPERDDREAHWHRRREQRFLTPFAGSPGERPSRR